VEGVEHLSNKYKALSANSGATKKKKKDKREAVVG
jgi:hypothetical protein